MTLKLSELLRIVAEFPPALHPRERRIAVQYPMPTLATFSEKPVPWTPIEEFIFESEAFFNGGDRYYSYRWKLITPAEIVFDTAL